MERTFPLTAAIFRQIDAYIAYYLNYGDYRVLITAVIVVIIGFLPAIFLDLLGLPGRIGTPRKRVAATGPRPGERRHRSTID